MERKIGEIFKDGDVTLQVVKCDSCNGCYFDYLKKCKNMICSSVSREDHKGVIFTVVKVTNLIDRINEGFEFLKKDCSSVLLAGFVNKNEIPEKASREEYDNEKFNHEYSDTNSDGWDEANFWGNIYLPLIDDLYMNFEVHA